MNAKTCPDQESLRKLLLGELRGPQAEQLEEHLLDCDDCSAAADTISASDELTAAIQSPDVVYGESDIVAKVIERGKQLRSQAETVETDETIITDSAQQAENAPDASSDSDETNINEEIDFLAPAQDSDEIGRLGDYRVLEVLGIGGMGVVFRAEDPKLKRQIALKAMKPAVAASKSAKDRFVREAQATAAIEHDNIVHIYQVGEDRNIPFIAMQFLRGESLQKRLEREKQLDQRKVLRIGREVAAGLEAAHKRELVHRDIKPDNIWIEEETGRAKILDFGLVRTRTDDAGLTQSGMVLGTPRYMAPEQAQGQTVDHRCDLFSLGSVLYHLATGKAPFEGGNLTATLIAVAQKDPDPVEQVCPQIEPALSQLIMRLLSKDRGQRLQSAAEVSKVIADIERQLAAEEAERAKQQQVAETTVLSQSPIAEPEPKPQLKSRSPIFFGGAVVTIALAVFAWLYVAGFIVKFESEHGTLIVKVTGGDFATSVKGQKVTIKNFNTNRTITIDLNSPEVSESLKPGTYFMLEDDSGLTTLTDRFTIRRGEDQVLEVTWKPKPQITEAKPGGGERGPDAVARAEDQSSGGDWPADAPPFSVAPFDAQQAKQHQQAWADYLDVPVEKEVIVGKDSDGKEIKLTMVLIPPGEFMMGKADEAQAKKFTQPFYLGQYEVTQAQWQAVMGGNPSQFQGSPAHPVEDVSWDDIQPFLAKLNEHASADEMKFALPTEAQWEFACRAGTTTSWYCGDNEDDLRQYGWFKANSRRTTYPVGQLKPNALGLYDMHGNVWEWCDGNADRYRAHRGGSWFDPGIRSAGRITRPGRNHSNNVGFRLAASIELPKLKPESPTVIAPDLAAAEYVVSVGGKLMTDRGDEWTDVVPEGLFRLTGVDLERKRVTDEGLAAFQGCSALETLNLSWTGITDAGVVNFKGCKKLTVLKLGTMVTNEGLAHFQDCDQLESLTLISSTQKITDAGLAIFKNCHELNHLYLHHTNVGDAGLAQLKACQKLARLHLDRSKVTDAGLAQLQAWPELQSLVLSYENVTDAGMAHLKDCQALTKLDLAGMRVTDVGIAHLKDCGGLTSIRIARTPGVSRKMAEELKQALPKCLVNWFPAQ